MSWVEWIHAGKSEAVSFRARAMCGCLTCRRLALSISLEAEEREDSARARRGVVILETLPLGRAWQVWESVDHREGELVVAGCSPRVRQL